MRLIHHHFSPINTSNTTILPSLLACRPAAAPSFTFAAGKNGNAYNERRIVQDMREYSIKRGHHPDFEALLEEYFEASGDVEEGIEFTADGIGVISIRRDGKSLFIGTKPQPDMQGGVDVIRRWNDFLEEATGRTAKERKKKLTDKAKDK